MKIKKARPLITYFCLVILATGVFAANGHPAEEIMLSTGQTVYVSIYSHIYSGVKGRPFDLAATLSIRNTDPQYPLTLVSVDYYDSAGKLVKKFQADPVKLNILASVRYIIAEGDKTGGSGANFIVKWYSEKEINPPIIEAVMIGTQSGQGISFVSRGQVIKDSR